MLKRIKQRIFSTLIFVYVLSIGFETLISIKWLGQVLYLPELVFLLLAGCTVVLGEMLAVIRQISKKNVIQRALFLYSGVVCLAWLAHPGFNSFTEWLGTVYMMGVFFIFQYFFQRYPDEKKRAATFFLWAGIICATSILAGYLLEAWGVNTGLFTYYANYPLLGDSERATGFTRHPIFLSAFMLTCLWASFSDANILDSRRFANLDFCNPLANRYPDEKWFIFFRKLFFIGYKISAVSLKKLLPGFLMAGAVLLTLSKSILPFLAAGLWYRYQKSNRAIWLMAGIGIVSAWLFFTHFSLVKKEHVADLIKAEYSAGYAIGSIASYDLIPTKYLLLKKTALQAWWEHPVTGIGGNELIHYNERQYQQGRLPVELSNSPHATLTGALGELGLLGFFSILFLFYALWKSSFHHQLTGQRYYVQAFIIFLMIESISGDLMNLRHLWVVFAWMSAEA